MPEPMKKVSVAMATYNGARFLPEQLDSIIFQDYSIGEIVICDDLSSDDTKSILEKYVTEYPNLIRVFYNSENLGYIRNFEKAVSLCTGEYIALSDQDDIWDSDKISSLVGNIGEHDLIHSDARLIDSQKKIISDSFSRYSQKRHNARDFVDLSNINSVTGCTLLFRSNLLAQNKQFPTCLPHDHWLALLACNRNGIVTYDRALISYRQHEANTLGAGESSGEDSILLSIQRKIANRSRKTDVILKRCMRRREYYRTLSNEYGSLFSEKNRRNLLNFYRYYDSYFTQKIRIRAFLFHIRHLGTFSNGKNWLQALYSLMSSVKGIK